MKEESTPSLGQWLNNRLYFSDSEKTRIIEDYLSGNETKKSIYKRYTRYPSEGVMITNWMRKFGIEDKYIKNTNFDVMPKQQE